jgi:2-polyprenyl-3-methyl-5-hydroxy-6-metoxy-1,4-benzoquinol methylase
MKINSRCYLCGCEKFKKRQGSVRDDESLEIFECTGCGLVFLSSFDHISDEFYEKSGMHSSEDMPDIQAWLNETRLDDERRFQFFKPILPSRRVLDFGCGAGGFLFKAQALSALAHGVEPESRLTDHYLHHGVTVYKNLLELSKNNQGEGYDLVTLFHVLEHIPDPKSLLSELTGLLAHEGQIIVEVPNADDALLTLYHSEPFSQFTYWSCHLFLFTAETLRTLFNQVNLKVNYINQVQRYPLSNHLHWLVEGKPGGHQKWNFLDSPELHAAYEKQLAAIGRCDTILASVSKY